MFYELSINLKGVKKNQKGNEDLKKILITTDKIIKAEKTKVK